MKDTVPSPKHGVPPNLGGEHSLLLVLVPQPHDFEQEDHELQLVFQKPLHGQSSTQGFFSNNEDAVMIKE